LVGETMACLTAIVAGLRFTDNKIGERTAAVLAVGDMVVDELFISALVCRFEDEIQRTVRDGGILTVELLDSTWLALHEQLFGDAVEVSAVIGSQWARLPSLAMHPGHAVSYVWATVLASAVQSRLLDGASQSVDRLVAAIDRGAVPADELPGLLGFVDDSWIAAGLDALEEMLGKLRAADTPA
jgi:oligoendopeptidase F